MSYTTWALQGACLCLLLLPSVYTDGATAEDQSKKNAVTLSRYRGSGANPLTLDEAIDEALRNNIALRQASAEVDIRQGDRQHAGRWTPSNPEVEIESAEREGPADTSTDLGIRISQELWVGGQRGIAKAAADAQVRAARSELDFLRTAVAARTRQAFLGLLWAQRSVDTAQRLLEINRAFREYEQARLEAGKSTATALNSAIIGVDRARAELADAKRAVTRRRLRLAEVLSRDASAPLKVTGKLQPWELSLPNTVTLLNQAVRQRQDLAAAHHRVVAAREDLRLSRRQWIPNLTVFGFYEEEEGADITGGGVSLPVPLIHRYQGERRSAEARLQQRQLDTDTLRLTVKREVLGAVADYRAAADKVATLGESTLPRAEENLSLLQQSFQAGKVGAPAITTAQDNLIAVRRSYLAALREFVDAIAALERASGGLVTVTASTAGSESS